MYKILQQNYFLSLNLNYFKVYLVTVNNLSLLFKIINVV